MKPKQRRESGRVKEPIQVYLAPEDRRLLDEMAEGLGLSRAEVLRRGVRSLAAGVTGRGSPMLALMERLEKEAWPADLAGRHDEELAHAYLGRRPPRGRK